MIVPQFWAEARLQTRSGRRRVTVRRFGFSDESQEAAQAHADARVREAHEKILAGAELPRREQKRAYAGADGLPIREEIVERHGSVIITRNSYGARCLNVPDVLFVDVDFESAPSTKAHVAVGGLCVASAVGIAVAFSSLWAATVGVFLALLMSPVVTKLGHRAVTVVLGGPDVIARRRVRAFSRRHPDWLMRVYRTPAGLRVLVMHRRFDPLERATSTCFEALGADPMYVTMCKAQRCFRARISPKPWRIGASGLSSLTRAVWPVHPSITRMRAQWIERYEKAARGYAACTFVESLGANLTDEHAERVRRIHDEACRATAGLPIA